ncbi:MAG: hypothetical protein DDT36_01638 [Firmicutes bacterium]|nr:hypothetical protein [Bacillota bacterium]
MIKVRLATREIGLLAILFAILILLGYYFFILQPLQARQTRLSASIATLEQELRRLERLETEEPVLRAEVAALKTTAELLLVKSGPLSLPQFLVSMEQHALDQGIQLRTLGLQNLHATEGGMVNLSFFGTYAGVYRFLQVIEAEAPLLAIMQVSLQSDGEAVAGDLNLRLSSAVIPERPGLVAPPRQSPFATGP